MAKISLATELLTPNNSQLLEQLIIGAILWRSMVLRGPSALG